MKSNPDVQFKLITGKIIDHKQTVESTVSGDGGSGMMIKGYGYISPVSVDTVHTKRQGVRLRY